jgi:cytochrome c oxidase cbb3-type subunit 3
MKTKLFAISMLTGITAMAQETAESEAAGAGILELWRALTADYLAMGLLLVAVVLLITILVLLNVVSALAKQATDQRVAELREQGVEVAEEEETSQSFWSRFMRSMTDATPVEEEGEVMTDHAYDGIKELDNNLPPWWLYGFYISIAWGVVFWGYYTFFGGPDQETKYEREMAEAQAEIEAYKATAKDLIDEETVTLLADASRLENGKEIFNTNCVACHGPDGGGTVGPNLTDDYFIHGGGIKNTFATIKNGVSGTAMIAWKSNLKPGEIQEVASYVLSLQGTTPANPKAAEGELWEGGEE